MNDAQVINAFNIEEFEVAEFGVLHVQNAKDDGPLLYQGQPVTIEMYGPGSQHYIRAQAKIDSATQARMFAAMRNKAKDSTDEQRANVNAKLVACTKSIINFPIPGGAQAICDNSKLGYIRDQMARFIEDWANFPPSSSKS
jgi:hypothetical protein